MISRFISAIRHVRHPNGAEAYYLKLQRSGRDTGPTFEQAKKDYQTLVHSEITLG